MKRIYLFITRYARAFAWWAWLLVIAWCAGTSLSLVSPDLILFPLLCQVWLFILVIYCWLYEH